jgi:F-type H+-transporting ATPase subunit gamma
LATPREIKKRINSVKNTRKITRTMEMVATSKAKKMSNKVNASKPFSEKLSELVGSLSGLSTTIHSPLLRKVDHIKKIALLVITANRGLCGGYNGNILRMTKARLVELKSEGIEVDLYVVGKKGISFFKYAKVPVVQSFTDLDDRSGYEVAENYANLFTDLFINEKVDRVDIISTVYHSSANQKPEMHTILPLSSKEESKGTSSQVIYEPSPERILESLLPQVVKSIFYKICLEAVTSEQIARRVAMKSATDAASDMIKLLTRGYNRIRQAKITQEISEIVAGADSLK